MRRGTRLSTLLLVGRLCSVALLAGCSSGSESSGEEFEYGSRSDAERELIVTRKYTDFSIDTSGMPQDRDQVESMIADLFGGELSPLGDASVNFDGRCATRSIDRRDGFTESLDGGGLVSVWQTGSGPQTLRAYVEAATDCVTIDSLSHSANTVNVADNWRVVWVDGTDWIWVFVGDGVQYYDAVVAP